MKRFALFLATPLLLGALVVACSGGDNSPSTDAGGETPASGEPTPATTPRPVPTFPSEDPRVPSLVVTAILQHDTIEMAGLTGYQRVACAEQASADAPECRPDESPGDQVEVLAFTPQCSDEQQWVRPEDVPPTYGKLAESPELVAVYTPSDAIQRYGSDVVVVVQSGVHEDGAAAGYAFHVAGGRIVWMEGDCNSIIRLLDNDRIDEYVVPVGWADQGA